MVCALGAGESLVGRSHECDNPSWVRTLPACSTPAFDVTVSSKEIDAEVNRRLRAGEPLYVIHDDLIAELRPDVVIAQEHCAVCAVTPGDVKRDSVLALRASTLEEIEWSVMRVGEALGLADKAREVVAHERERMETVRAKTSGRRKPTVVMMEWTAPVFAMGNWGPELVEIANGELLLGEKGKYSTAIPGERVAESDPEVLIVAPCGYELDRALRERAVLEQYDWWRGLRAVKSGKVAFADGNLYFNRSGMTVARTAEMIAEILHGVTFGDPMQGVGWRWID